MVETDARRLWWKNAKALRLGIEASERLARETKSAKAKAAHHTQEQQSRAIRLLTGYISSTSENGTTNSDDDPPICLSESINICLPDDLVCDVGLHVSLLHGFDRFGCGDMCTTVADIDILVLPAINTSTRAQTRLRASVFGCVDGIYQIL